MKVTAFGSLVRLALLVNLAGVPPAARASGSFEVPDAPPPTVSVDPDSLGPRDLDGGQSRGNWGTGRERRPGGPAGPSFGDLRGLAPALPAIDAFIARQPGNVVVAPSPHGFPRTVQRLKAAIRANDLILVAVFDAQARLARGGAVIGGNQVLDVYPIAVAARLVAMKLEAGNELPVRIYIYEDRAGQTWVKYHSLQQRLSLYADPRLIAFGQEVDAQMAKIFASALE
jgi:uncharacterized protein (DUF302 family)